MPLEIRIDLSYELDRPYTEGGSADLAFSATVTLGEQAAATLIDAGFSKIDIISVQIASFAEGATPSLVDTSLAAAPINDFDLDVDTDENGVAGPHRFELETVTIATNVNEGADQVEFAQGLDQVSLVLGDVELPADCPGATLTGFTVVFPVGPRG